MQFIRSFGCLLACSLLVSGAATAQDPNLLKTKLEAEFKGKVLQIRGFPKNNEIVITSDGKLLTKLETGLWTMGLIEIDGITINADEIVFKGSRVALVSKRRNVSDWRREPQVFGPIRLFEPMKIRVVGTKSFGGDLLSAKWRDVFILERDELPDLVPEYWKKYVTTVSERPIGEGPRDQKGVYRLDGEGITAPLRQVTPDAYYPPLARARRLSGLVILEAVIGTDGRATDISVQRALGLGCDEEAVKALKEWQFRPALKDKTPIPVVMNIEMLFGAY